MSGESQDRRTFPCLFAYIDNDWDLEIASSRRDFMIMGLAL